MPTSPRSSHTRTLSMISPSSVLFPLGGAALALFAGLPWWSAILVAVVAWSSKIGASSLIARSQSSRGPRIDPFTLAEPWRNYVKDALGSRTRFRRALKDVEDGPLLVRLSEIGGRVDRGVEECWEVARKGHQLTDARRSINVAAAKRSVETPGNHPDLISAANSEMAAHKRLTAREDSLKTSLKVLNARLDEAVARAAEMSTRADTLDDLTDITNAIDGIVGDLESLRIGLDTVDEIR